MSTPDGQSASKLDDEPETTVLVLTDGSTQARRVAEWELVFTDAARAAIHRIDVIDCLDSGMIIHRHTDASTDKTNQIRGHEPEIEVLHGVPHEALLDYVAANAIDLVVIGVCDRTDLSHSFIGNMLATVSQTATVPVMTTRGREECFETRYG